MLRQFSSASMSKSITGHITEQCDKHPERLLEYYCSDHGTLGCTVCMTVKHRQCQHVDYVSDLSMNLLDRPDYQQFTNSLSSLKNDSNDVIKGTKLKISIAETLYADVTEHSQDLRNKVMQEFDKLDKVIKKDIDSIKSEDLKKMKTNGDRGKEVLSEVAKISAELQTLKNKNKLSQLFVRMMKLKGSVQELETVLNWVKRNNNVTTYWFETGALMQAIIEKGPISIGKLLKRSPVTLGPDSDVSYSDNSDSDSESASSSAVETGYLTPVSLRKYETMTESPDTAPVPPPAIDLTVSMPVCPKATDNSTQLQDSRIAQARPTAAVHKERLASLLKDTAPPAAAASTRPQQHTAKGPQYSDTFGRRKSERPKSAVATPDQQISKVLTRRSLNISVRKKPESQVVLAPTATDPFSYKESREKIATHVGDINIRTMDDETPCRITGSTVLRGNTLILTDCYNKKIKLLNLQTSNVESEIRTISEPWDVARITDDQVAVSLFTARKIVFLNVRSGLNEERKIRVGGTCTAILHNDGKLFVAFCEPLKIEIMALNGTVENKIERYDMIEWPSHMALNLEEDAIYVTDNGDECHSVKLIGLNGVVEAEHKDELLRYPKDIIVDQQGNVLVCGSDNIHLLTPNLSKIKLLVEGLSSPSSLSLCHRTDRLYVGMEDSHVLHVFQLQ